MLKTATPSPNDPVPLNSRDVSLKFGPYGLEFCADIFGVLLVDLCVVYEFRVVGRLAVSGCREM